MPQYESYENCVKLSDFIYSRSIEISIQFKILMKEICKCRKKSILFFLLLLLYYILFIIILFYLYVLFNKINKRVF